MRPAPLATAFVFSLLTVSLGAWPGPRHHPPAVPLSATTPALRFGRSIGSPTEGRLLGGLHLEETPYLRIVPTCTAGDVRWGLEPLVSLIDRAARMVHKQFPDAVMSVGHLSRPGGGEIDRHHSHESGRDADIGFFVRSQTGKPVLAPSFLTFKPDGTATHNSGAHFDEAQNWAFVQAVLTDPGAHVSYLFVASPLRARLLAHAERIGAPSALRVRAAEVMVQPRGVLPHDDHFHVRIACPSRMAGCIENPTPLTKPGQAKAKVPGRHRDHSKGTKRLQHHSRFRPAEPAKPVPRPEPEDRDLILSTPSSDDDADGSP